MGSVPNPWVLPARLAAWLLTSGVAIVFCILPWFLFTFRHNTGRIGPARIGTCRCDGARRAHLESLQVQTPILQLCHWYRSWVLTKVSIMSRWETTRSKRILNSSSWGISKRSSMIPVVTSAALVTCVVFLFFDTLRDCFLFYCFLIFFVFFFFDTLRVLSCRQGRSQIRKKSFKSSSSRKRTDTVLFRDYWLN